MTAMGDQVAKQALFDSLASVAKALGSGRRAEIVDVLAQAERSVEDLAGEIGQSVANTSQHLQVLGRVGLVATRRQGNRVLYRLAGDDVNLLWSVLRSVAAANVDAVDRLAGEYLGDRSQVEVMARPELARVLSASGRSRARRDLLVWDVRPEPEYQAGHIPGAVSVPPDSVETRLDATAPRSGRAGPTVVAYCRGPFCVYADDAVRALRSRGIRAMRLEDGFPEWRRAGLPVEVHQ